jgi:hypothetical protein
MAGKELGYAKKLYMCCGDSEIVINPFAGIRLAKTENIRVCVCVCVCVTVKCKVYINSYSSAINCSSEWCV